MTKPAQPRVVRVRFRYQAEGLTPADVVEYNVWAAERLVGLFELAPKDVDVTGLPQLQGGEPFVLSCYIRKSETDPVAMVEAAKAVLPRLLAMKRQTQAPELP